MSVNMRYITVDSSKEDKPVFVGKPRVIRENKGKRVVIEIDVVSKSKPESQWAKDDKAIKDEGRYIIEVFESQPNMYILVLEIDDLHPEDAGKYKCTAKNAKGDASTQVDLKVDGKQS